MSYYDQLAFANKPTFYLASPSTTDQSLGSVVVAANTMALSGQPIIYGHKSSFTVKSGSTIDLNGNIAFTDGVTTEFVLFAQKPVAETPVILSDNGSGIFITPTSIVFRLAVVSNGVSKQLAGEIRISNWSRKQYVQLIVGANQAVLVVNKVSKAITLKGTLDTAITQTSIGKTFSTGYYFLIDGVGFYKGRVASKQDSLDDPGVGHSIYSSYLYKGQTTIFNTFDRSVSQTLTLKDFRFDAATRSRIYSFRVSNGDQSSLYLNVHTNDAQAPIQYDLNGGTILTFTKSTVINISNLATVVTFSLPMGISDEFKMTIDTVLSANILSHTPAFLKATGTPVFPSKFSESIVNCPQGVNMDLASYAGTWLYPEEQTAPPKTIELVFKPKQASSLGPNLLANPGFEPNVTSWSTTAATISQDATKVHSGSFAAKVVPSGTATQSYISSENIAVTTGTQYTVSVWVWLTTAVTNGFTCSIDWFNSTSTYLSTTSSSVSVSAGAWTQVSNTFTAPAGAAYGNLSAVLIGSPPATNIFYVDDATFSKVNPTIVFSSTDGKVNLVTQSGYTMWLNGVSVADLSGVLWNQWNHLILTIASPAATTFFINTDGAVSTPPQPLDYLFISSYPNVLATADIQTLYSVVSGLDILTVAEAPVPINEGVFGTGGPFATYSLTWSIVGVGGSS